MRPYSVAGTIEYITDDIGLMGVEHFRITRLASGGRHLRAYCEMHDDSLERDTLLRVNAGWQPEDAYVHVSIDSKPLGSAHYAFSPEQIALQRRVGGGPVETRVQALSTPATAFASHSVENDAWLYAAFDRARGSSDRAEVTDVAVCSSLPNGGEAPGLFMTSHQHQYHGEEKIIVPAGTFDTRHYTFHLPDWPPIHYWVHGDDYIMVKCRWDYLKQSYLLTELNVTS